MRKDVIDRFGYGLGFGLIDEPAFVFLGHGWGALLVVRRPVGLPSRSP